MDFDGTDDVDGAESAVRDNAGPGSPDDEPADREHAQRRLEHDLEVLVADRWLLETVASGADEVLAARVAAAALRRAEAVRLANDTSSPLAALVAVEAANLAWAAELEAATGMRPVTLDIIAAFRAENWLASTCDKIGAWLHEHRSHNFPPTQQRVLAAEWDRLVDDGHLVTVHDRLCRVSDTTQLQITETLDAAWNRRQGD